jgi:hypothetical protein
MSGLCKVEMSGFMGGLGVPREKVCAGLRGAQVEIERRLDGSHWLRFRGHYLHLHPCPDAVRSASPSGLRPAGLADQRTKPPTESNLNTMCLPITLGENHGSGHLYFALKSCISLRACVNDL